VHLQLDGETQLAKAMQGLQLIHTLYCNRQYKLVGHLFHGRYKDIRQAPLFALQSRVRRSHRCFKRRSPMCAPS
jgi:hypothetical protein